MMKTAVMMIGEFEYNAIFFDHMDDGPNLPYKPLSLVFFIAFMIIMPIIIMNLLVRLTLLDTRGLENHIVSNK